MRQLTSTRPPPGWTSARRRRQVRLVAFVVLVHTALAVDGGAPASPVVNGDFENGLESWRVVIKQEGAVTVGIDQKVLFIKGQGSLRVDIAAPEARERGAPAHRGVPVFIRNDRPIRYTPGTSWVLSAWVKATAPISVGIKLDGWYAKNPFHWYKGTRGIAGETWTRLHMRIDFDGPGSPKYNPDLKEVSLHLTVRPGAPAGTLWIDGVYLGADSGL